MVLELKRRNEKSILLETTKKNITDDLIKKMLVKYLELNDDNINNYAKVTIDETIKGLKRDSIIKYDSIEYVVTGNKNFDYIKLKSKYQGATLMNNDFVIIYD